MISHTTIKNYILEKQDPQRAARGRRVSLGRSKFGRSSCFSHVQVNGRWNLCKWSINFDPSHLWRIAQCYPASHTISWKVVANSPQRSEQNQHTCYSYSVLKAVERDRTSVLTICDLKAYSGWVACERWTGNMATCSQRRWSCLTNTTSLTWKDLGENKSDRP
jgi:hypothetical protein